MNETKKIIPILNISRSCNGCTACCDGWLHGEAHGHEFFPGRKCHFVSTDGCTIYEERPYDPCHTFKCDWLVDHNFPEWLKPSLSNVIFRSGEINGMPYLRAFEMGVKMNSDVLSWLLISHIQQKLPNIVYSFNGFLHRFGSQEFLEAVDRGLAR